MPELNDEIEEPIEAIPTARMSSSQLSRIITESETDQYEINQAYFEGNNPTLINKTVDSIPDNRVPLPFARKTVNDITGYAYKPGKVRYIFEDEETNKESIQFVKDIFKDNDEPLVSGEIFEDSLIKGEGAELMWFADDKIQFTQVPRSQCTFIYKDTIKDVLDKAIRYYTLTTIDDKGNKIEIKHADVYWDDMIEHYETFSASSTATIDQQEDAKQVTEDPGDYHLISVEDHFFGSPPLYPYQINKDRLGVFQPSIPLIDILDDFGSDSIANAVNRFNETVMLFSKNLEDVTAENIKDFKIFDNMGGKEEGNFVEYLTRQMDITSTVEGFKLFERLYYELTGVPSLSDDKFNVKSGVAILYALVPFENLVSRFEIYFSRGLLHRLKLINVILETLSKPPVEATLKWERNLPMDLQHIVEVIAKARETGLLSDETLLKMFPENVVTDVAEELEAVNEQKKKAVEEFGNLQSANANEEPEEDDDTEEDDE